ncbi:MAG TPA: hypothetical protein VHM26_07290 [Chitinophagaceae bacterium]|jgi:hypothetical protein|nr:hypothetical protein [Chitinophagaceae bacterium]
MDILKGRHKEIITLLMAVFLVQAINAQYDSIAKAKADKRYRVRNIIWYTPNGAKQINGLAVGIQATTFDEKRKLTINGINLDAGLICAFGWPRALVRQFEAKGLDESMLTDTAETKINGISISFGGELSAGINGVAINGLIMYSPYINGISVSGFVTACGRFKGIMITGISNAAIEGTGLQIGLFNNCKRLKGLQIGLWNKSGKRGLPFINWGM